MSYLVDECRDFIGGGGEGGGKCTIPTVRNLQRKSRIVRVFLGVVGAVTDARIKRASSAYLSPTSLL